MWYYGDRGDKMIRIAIVDDEKEEIIKIKTIVEKFFQSNDIEYQIKEFYSGEDLLDYTEPFDLIFLDIQMNGIDGIETAMKIRSKDKKAALIYISNYSEKMALSFAVHPFAFLEKPINSSDIQKHLKDYFSYAESRYKKNMVVFTGQHGEIIADINNIIYFEYEGNRKIRLIMTDKKYLIMGSISELSERMEQYDFIIPHKSFLVNKAEIRAFNSTLVMSNGDEIPIAKNRQKQVREQINKFLHRHLID